MAFAYISTTYLALAAVVPLLLNFFYKMYRARTRYRHFAQPPRSFLLGHLGIMGEVASQIPPNAHPQLYFTMIAQKYNLPDVFYLDLWPVSDSQLILIDPQFQETLTVTRSPNQHQMSADFIEPILGPGVIAAVNGPVWKRLHNAMAPAFSWSHIRNASGVVRQEVMHFRAALDGLADSREVFDMEELSAKLIFDVITRVVFNFSLGAQQKGSQTLEDLHALVKLAEAQLSFNPLVKLRAWFKRRVVNARLNPEILGKIEERLSLLKQEKIVPSKRDPLSILDLMLRETVVQEDASARSLSAEDKQMFMNNIKGLLLGGHGTTTDTFCFCLMLLSKHPDVVAEMRAEHDTVFGTDLETTLQTLQDEPEKVEALPYSTAVIKETLRLFPVGFSPKAGAKGSTITHNGLTYPLDGDYAVVPAAHTLHYDPRFYPSPSAFRPSRFLDPATALPRSHWRPFSRGTRACLGQNFAVNELLIILLLTIREYDFDCAGLRPNNKAKAGYTRLDEVFGDVVFQELGLEAKPRGGMLMKVRKVRAGGRLDASEWL